MHVGYCEVYSYSFRSFFDDWSQSSWNIRYEGKKVPQEEQFQGTKFLRRSLRKFLQRSFQRNERRGTKVPQERKFNGLFAVGNESAKERKVRHSIG